MGLPFIFWRGLTGPSYNPNCSNFCPAFAWEFDNLWNHLILPRNSTEDGNCPRLREASSYRGWNFSTNLPSRSMHQGPNLPLLSLSLPNPILHPFIGGPPAFLHSLLLFLNCSLFPDFPQRSWSHFCAVKAIFYAGPSFSASHRGIRWWSQRSNQGEGGSREREGAKHLAVVVVAEMGWELSSLRDKVFSTNMLLRVCLKRLLFLTCTIKFYNWLDRWCMLSITYLFLLHLCFIRGLRSHLTKPSVQSRQDS